MNMINEPFTKIGAANAYIRGLHHRVEKLEAERDEIFDALLKATTILRVKNHKSGDDITYLQIKNFEAVIAKATGQEKQPEQ